MCKSTRAAAHALVAAIAMVVLVLALTGQSALAGQYHVYTCRTPDERPAPTDGWTKSTVPPGAGNVAVEDTCASGGALTAAVKDGVKHEVGTSAEWELGVPGGELVKQIILWRAGNTEGGASTNATYQFVVAAPNRFESFTGGECLYASGCRAAGESTSPMALTNLLAVPPANIGSHLYLTAACGGLPGYSCPEGKNDPNGYAAAVYLYAADVVLEDSSQPTVVPDSVTGELAEASTVSGKASLLFSAEDEGSGVRDAVVSVDGTPMAPTQLDSNGGHCADLGEATDGLAGYDYMQPCASVVGGEVQLDTTGLSDGTHRLTVVVRDAAGNATTVLDRQVDVANGLASAATSTVVSAAAGAGVGVAGAGGGGVAGSIVSVPNGSPASSPALLSAHWARTAKVAYVGRWGKAASVVGRLTTPSGAPIAGAAIEVSATPSSQGAKAQSIGTPRTGADGRFRLRLSPKSSSERIALVYRAHTGDVTPAATSVLTLTVAAHLVLSVAPKVSQVHGTIRFKGVLAGAPMPAGGKQVALQAHAPGAPWRTFQLLSTDRHGRYRASYRFRLPGSVVYGFRAISPQEADFPFGRGMSNVVKVMER